MFWDKKSNCRQCSFAVNKKWEFCPNCGEDLNEKAMPQKVINPFSAFGNFGGIGIFDQIFKQMEKQMRDLDREFSQTSTNVQHQPRGFKIINPRGGGISISIIQSGQHPPQINVHTSGEFRQMEPEIKRGLGVAEGGGRNPSVFHGGQALAHAPRQEKFETKLSSIKETAEPETEIKKTDGKISYTITLPDVKKVDDIQIKRLPNSVEIRAVSGNKMYFKLFEAPQNLGIVEKSFKSGVLKIVLG